MVGNPIALPRPVVKAIRLQPPAARPVRDTGSYPGVFMNVNPGEVTASAYSYTSISVEVPPFATAPSDFSRMLVRPPALFPGLGLSSKLPSKRFRYRL